MMKAYSTASGGVIFVPDELERTGEKPLSYSEIVSESGRDDVPKRRLFGRAKSGEKPVRSVRTNVA